MHEFRDTEVVFMITQVSVFGPHDTTLGDCVRARISKAHLFFITYAFHYGVFVYELAFGVVVETCLVIRSDVDVTRPNFQISTPNICISTDVIHSFVIKTSSFLSNS
jgi:hypothetical protein